MKHIRELKENESVVSFSLVRSKQIKTKRNGEPYIQLVLADRTGQIQAKIWDDVDTWREQIQEGDCVKYKGTVEVYSGVRQLVVERIRQARPEDAVDGFSERELTPSTEYDVGEMWRELNELASAQCRRPCVLQLVTEVLNENRDRILTFPAATEVHHNYWGGYLEHVLSVLKSALHYADRFPSLDRDLLVAGAILHDIGKLAELRAPQNPAYTAEGILIGHVVLGRDMVREAAKRIPDFPASLLVLLEHIVISHQGQPEWGSPKRPKIAEALVLHYIDDLDAKLNRFFRLLRDDQNDSDFTSYDRILERVLFKGGRDEEVAGVPA